MKAVDYIRKGWTQGAYARGKNGRPVLTMNPCAVRWCAFGALLAAYPKSDDLLRAETKLLKLVDTISLAAWNDDPARTRAEVIAAFEKAGI